MPAHREHWKEVKGKSYCEGVLVAKSICEQMREKFAWKFKWSISRNSLYFGVYTEPKRAHYEEQFEHNEKVGRRICRCHLPISKIIGDDLGENGKTGEGQHQPRLLFESSAPRGKTPEDTYFFYLLFVRLIA